MASVLFSGIEEVEKKIRESPQWRNFTHADEIETSCMLYLKPELVKMDQVGREYPNAPEVYPFVPMFLRKYCETGIFGDATKASRTKGERMIKHTIGVLKSLVTDLSRSQIPEKG